MEINSEDIAILMRRLNKMERIITEKRAVTTALQERVDVMSADIETLKISKRRGRIA